MFRAKLMFLILSVVLCTGVCQGQWSSKMTNSDVAIYVRLGEGDETIIEKIRTAKNIGFDLSPDGIKALKEEKVSDAVINAMAEKQRAIHEAEEQLGITGLPAYPGLFGKTTNGWVSLGKVPAVENSTGEKSVSLGGHSKVKYDYKYKYANKSAEAQVKGPRPTFFLRQAEDSKDFEELKIIRVEQKKDFRQVEWWMISNGQSTTGVPENPVVIQVQAKRLRDDIVAYTPDSDLTPGEYLMYGNNIGYAYQFGIVEQ